MIATKPASIDEYIAGLPENVQTLLEQMRTAIRKAAPEAAETISYAIPTFTLNGKNLVHFAAFKNHIGFYPTPNGNEAFRQELSAYKGGKGSVQFPLGEPLPLALVTKVVKFRVAETGKKPDRKKK